MGVVGCILGFLVVIYLCYKDWSVYIASIVGAAVVIAFNVLPFMDTLLGSYVNGMFVPIKSFFFLLLAPGRRSLLMIVSAMEKAAPLSE